jgi:hypothetical protein
MSRTDWPAIIIGTLTITLAAAILTFAWWMSRR